MFLLVPGYKLAYMHLVPEYNGYVHITTEFLFYS